MKTVLLSFVLCALLAFPAFALTTDDAEIVSKASLATMHLPDGSLNGDGTGGFGGGPNITYLFDGKFDNPVYLPMCNNGNNYSGVYLLCDFTTELASGYYVTKILVGAHGKRPFSLYWTADGTAWTNVVTSCMEDGVVEWSIGEIVKQVKVVFEQLGANQWDRWDYSTPQISELQVWGVNPALLECSHPSFTDWELLTPATCTEPRYDHRYCMVCDAEFIEPVGDPLGHDYISHLVREGTLYRYGSGFLDCGRCDFHVDFSRPVDMVELGGLAERGLVQFADCTVSSEDHPQWGHTSARHLIDGNWENNYWAAVGLNDAYIDWTFGTEIDLTSIDFSVVNHAQTLQFFRKDGEEETLIAEAVIEPNEEEGAPNWIRQTVEFRDVTGVTAIRIRILDEIGLVPPNGSQAHDATVRELHPYGTVVGAGKRTHDSTTIMILR